MSKVLKSEFVLQWSALAVRVMLGVWFLYSGGMKLWVTGLDRFTRDIANYKLVSEPLDAIVAYSVPWLEVVAGLCLMLGLWRRGAIIVLFGLVLGFSFFISWAWVHQLDISCGCQGGDAPIRYWAKALELSFYVLILTGLWWAEGSKKFDVEQKMQNMA